VWPLSLLVLRQISKNLQLNRDYRSDESTWRCDGGEKSECSSENFVRENKNEESREFPSRHDNLFLKHVKIKKRHEIQQIARVQLHVFSKYRFRLDEIFIDLRSLSLHTDVRGLCARIQCQVHCGCRSGRGSFSPIPSV